LDSSSSSSSSYDDHTVFEVTTTGADYVEIDYAGAVAYMIDWGEGAAEYHGGTGTANHTYSGAGVWKVIIKGYTELLRLEGVGSHLTAIITPITGITGVTVGTSMFNGCSSLTSLPDGLFDSLTDITTFRQAFRNCVNLASLPDGLFDNNTAVTTFQDVFNGCINLTTIPDGLFDNNTLVTYYTYAFSNCTSLTSFAPELWELDPLPDGFQCFYECTNASNYDDIPEYWGGPAVSSSSSSLDSSSSSSKDSSSSSSSS